MAVEAPLWRPVIDLPAAGSSETRLLSGGAGRIEALVAVPAGPPRGVAVVCHPHPLFGGALTNKVAYALASCAQKAGLVTARFNFRGVGKSDGAHDEGRGETEDTLAVATWLRERVPGASLLLAGFSFGAFVSLKAAARAVPALQISIAPPFKYFEGEPLPPRPAAPWLVVHGRDDEVVAYEDTRAVLARYQPPPELVTLDGTGHYFHGRLRDLDATVGGFIQRHWPG
ncbi:MAG: alpha/beta hydrolase [Nevskiaceae bacterium]